MKFVYTANCKCPAKKAGDPVEVGDIVKGLHNSPPEEQHIVTFFREPSSPASSGKVSIRLAAGDRYEREVYASIIGAEWIDREDRR